MQTSSIEQWKPIAGFEGRYEVSSFGNVKAIPFMQRYLLRNGKEAWRRTKERTVATQLINSGYLIVHLHLNNERRALLVHRLVALAFLNGPIGQTVNHIDGVKTANRADNLEWATYTENHLHAVDMRLNKAAIPVIDPATGIRYPSIAQAAAKCNRSHHTVRHTFIIVDRLCPA